MIKIYDCSNSNERPIHRQISLCPKQNSIVKDLKKYAKEFNCEFISNYKKADILFTNDIFPSHLINSKLPKIKRMDGIFQTNDLKSRNKMLNNSAKASDFVIFISNFSKDSFFKLYNITLSHYTVIHNFIDNNIFYPTKQPTKEIIFSACCSNWERPEKRLTSLIALVNSIKYI